MEWYDLVMDKRGIIFGRHAAEKRELARRLRREMTGAERALWDRVRRSQLAGLHFRRQQIIDGFVADFYCHAAGLVVEVDGGVHVGQTDYDAERTEALERMGLRVVRFGNERVLGDVEGVLREILEAARGGAAG
jgi:very-short-patch-repair endonuclease